MKSLVTAYKQRMDQVMSDLITVILDELRSVQPKRQKWKVVVLDRHSRKLVEQVMPLSEFYDENVTDVQMLENIRESNTTFEAAYFLTARSENIRCLLHDFQPGQALYAAAHLFFLNAASDDLVQQLAKIGNNVRTLKEIFLDFVPQESQVFSTHDADAPKILYNPNCISLVESLIKEMAMKIVCICALLGEYPLIRYYKPVDALHPSKSLSAKLATVVQSELDNHARNNEGFPPKSDRPRGILFITDRSMDMFAPLLHEFTYQAMANDLLPIKDGVFFEFEVGSAQHKKEKIQEVISEKDAAWLAVRHLHMSLAIDQLVAEFNKFSKDNSDFTDDTKSTNLNTIRNMLAGMDSYAQGKDKYSLYITMAQECMAKFEHQKLPASAQVEQECATGCTVQGKYPKQVLESMVPLLDDESISTEDRVRMLMIYIIFKGGIFPDDRLKLMRHAKIPAVLQQAIVNLELLGIPRSKTERNQRFKKTINQVDAEDAFELSRYKPSIKKMVEEHLRGDLDQVLFPYTRDVPTEPEKNLAGQSSLRTNRPTWAKGRIGQEVARQRVIVFCSGGVTYSEVRSAYELSTEHNRDVILGSSNILTPGGWLEILSSLRADRDELHLARDQPKPLIPLLEQRKPDPVPEPRSSPARSKQPPTIRQSPARTELQRPSPMPEVLRGSTSQNSLVNSIERAEEKKKKGFGLFGKKK